MEISTDRPRPSPIREACLRAYEDRWIPPSGPEVAAALDLARLSVSAAAELVGVSERRVQAWIADAGVPYAVWVLFCQEAGFGVLWDRPTP